MKTKKYTQWSIYILLTCCLCCLLSACGPNLKFHKEVDTFVSQNDFVNAKKIIEDNKDKYAEKNAVLYYLDYGILAHYGGEYEDSCETLSKADGRIEELFTESISKQASSYVVNDNVLPYKGEDFESVMVNLFQSLNYLQLNKIDDALVEARKVDSKLSVINDQYDEDKKNVYKEDAFVRLLMGVLYEIGGTSEDLNDAYISYKKAELIYNNDYVQNYQLTAPSCLVNNLLATADYMGQGELEEARETYPDAEFSTLDERKDKAEIYFIHYNGKAPQKKEETIVIPIPQVNHVSKIAFPIYEERPYSIKNSKIKLIGTNNYKTVFTESGEDIKAIAMKNLENRKVRTIAKATARALVKYGIKKGVGKAVGVDTDKGLLGFGLNLLGNAIEKADTRACMVMPAEIRIGKAVVQPGNYNMEAECLAENNSLIKSLPLGSIDIKKGEKRFVFFRTID